MSNKKLFLVFLVIVIFSCTQKPVGQETFQEITLIEETEEPPVVYSLTLSAVGDNLFHETILRTSLVNGVYDFSPIYTEIRDLVRSADLAFINQETVMAGEEFGYSGYPLFNTPQSLAQTLVDTGFSIINQANNHSMDMGRAGLYATLDLWETIDGVTVLGTRKSGASYSLITRNNITLGFLSYTYGLNGIPLPRGEPNLVSVINRTRMAEELKELRPLCDFLIVSMHWGEEYLMEPDSYQTGLARFLAEHNVDLIIGHHPHVLQKVELLPRPDGKQTLCFYSLGNFASNQREKERVLGGMMAVTFVKEEDNHYISDYGLIPVVCHFEPGFANTKVYPFYSYSEELLEKHHLQRFGTIDYDFIYSVLWNLNTRLYIYNPFIRKY